MRRNNWGSGQSDHGVRRGPWGPPYCLLVCSCFGFLFLSSCVPYSTFELPQQVGGSLPKWSLSLEAEPVLLRGRTGEFDFSDALNPSVIKRGPSYLNLYSGYDGKAWHTGLATSVDGIAWTKKGKVLSPGPAAWEGSYIAANGAVIEHNGELLYFYQAGSPPQIGLARSTDGLHWTKNDAPVLPIGPYESWDERGVGDPYVIETGGSLYLYYLGQDRARRQRLGVAVSTDGVRWNRLIANPILELGEPGAFDEVGLGEPAVWASHGYYWMLYTGRDKGERRRMGLAYSRNGAKWLRYPGEPFAGQAAWNSQVVCDATVLLENGKLRLWFGGGDRALPAEGLNGQIGAAVLEVAP